MAGNVASDPMPARHVFRFVISGTELSAEHEQVIADRVAQAGVEALASLDLPRLDKLVIERLEWRGIWLHLLAESIEREGIHVDRQSFNAPGL